MSKRKGKVYDFTRHQLERAKAEQAATGDPVFVTTGSPLYQAAAADPGCCMVDLDYIEQRVQALSPGQLEYVRAAIPVLATVRYGDSSALHLTLTLHDVLRAVDKGELPPFPNLRGGRHG